MRSVACLCLCAFLLGGAESAKDVFDGAVRALAAGDYETAERGFQSVLRAEPRNVAALGNLGVVYSHTNRADQAITVYRRALQLSPDDKAILLNLGLVYLKQEAHSKAIPLFARVVELDPQHMQAGSCSQSAAPTPANWRQRSAISRPCTPPLHETRIFSFCWDLSI